MNRYFGWLLVLLALSLGSVVLVAALAKLPVWLGLLPVVPLIAYHLVILRPRAKTLRPSEIDSVYYFGFLITVAALAATAVEIAAGEQSGHVESVLYKFGLGLLATGYAVIARLHLQSLADNEAFATPDQALETYLGRSGALLDNLETSILRFGSLAETAMTETERVAETSRTLLERNTVAVTDAVAKELRTTFEATKVSVSEVRLLLSDTAFMAERKAFQAVLGTTVEVSERLQEALAALNGTVNSGVDTFHRADSAIASLASASSTLRSALQDLSSEKGVLAGVAVNVQAASEGSLRAARSAEEAATRILDMSGKLSASGASFASFGESVSRAGKEVDDLSAACNRLGVATAKLTAAITTTRDIAASLDALNQVLPGLTPRIPTLAHELDGLKSALGQAASSLEGDVQRSANAVALLADNLAAVAQTIVDRTRERLRV